MRPEYIPYCRCTLFVGTFIEPSEIRCYQCGRPYTPDGFGEESDEIIEEVLNDDATNS